MIPKALSTRTNVKHEYFRNSLSSSTVIEWNKLDKNIQNLESVSAFKKQILKFIRPSPNNSLMRRILVELNYLQEYQLGQVNCVNTNLDTILKTPQTHSATAVGILNNYPLFFHCSNYSNQRKTLFEKISDIKRSLLNQNDSITVETLHFGSNGLNDEENARIIESTIKYIITTERFINPFQQITTFLEISNWFWITLCHTFQLLSCSMYVYICI